MNIETWLTFAAATALLLVIPGPTVLLVVSYALGRGLRAASPSRWAWRSAISLQ